SGLAFICQKTAVIYNISTIFKSLTPLSCIVSKYQQFVVNFPLFLLIFLALFFFAAILLVILYITITLDPIIDMGGRSKPGGHFRLWACLFISVI
ncbi:MAG: hypothetical protein ACYSSI_09035, partial [Planctomycetota bacterium]